MKLRVIVPPHPLIGHWLSMLRDISTPPVLYGKAFEEIGKWLTYECIRDWLPRREETITTSNGEAKGTVVESSVNLMALINLPGGLELWNGAKEVLPNASLFIGGVPSTVPRNAGIIIFWDQITNGFELLEILEIIKARCVETKRIRVITSLASAPGLKNIGESLPDLTIYAACIDPEISTEKEIKPGIGNPLNRLNTITVDSN